MTDNPYAAPAAAISNRNAGGTARLYSPVQVACGTIGGPVGLIYFLKSNFAALGNDRLEKRTLILGALFIAALVVSVPFLPDRFPSLPFTAGYIAIAWYVSSRYQMTKQAIAASPLHDFHSNWRVLGMGLLCLAASVVVLVGPLIALIALGWWNP